MLKFVKAGLSLETRSGRENLVRSFKQYEYEPADCGWLTLSGSCWQGEECFISLSSGSVCTGQGSVFTLS